MQRTKAHALTALPPTGSATPTNSRVILRILSDSDGTIHEVALSHDEALHLAHQLKYATDVLKRAFTRSARYARYLELHP